MAGTPLVHKPGTVYTQPKPKEQRQLFKKHVKTISIETHSYCNRQCWFCPNSFLDRHSFRGYLPEPVYLQVLDDLARIGYTETITFARYMEPFADDIIYKRIAQAKKAVPKAFLRAPTNGDFITSPAVLERVRNAGLRNLRIQLYPPKSDSVFDKATVLAMAERKQKQLGVHFHITKNKSDWLEWSGDYKGMYVGMRARNFRVNGQNRGGIDVSGRYVRTAPCRQAFHTICVHYTGEVIPCCHLRSDHPDHKYAIMGTVDDTSGKIFEIYTSKKTASWRGALLGNKPKTGVCEDCAVNAPARKRKGG